MGCASQEIFKKLSGTLSKESTQAILRTLLKLYKYGGTTEEKLIETLITDEHIKPKDAKAIVQTALMAGVEFGAIVKTPDIIYKLDDEFYSFLVGFYMMDYNKRKEPFKKRVLTDSELYTCVKKTRDPKKLFSNDTSPARKVRVRRSFRRRRSLKKRENQILAASSISIPFLGASGSKIAQNYDYECKRNGRRFSGRTRKHRHGKKKHTGTGGWLDLIFNRRKKCCNCKSRKGKKGCPGKRRKRGLKGHKMALNRKRSKTGLNTTVSTLSTDQTTQTEKKPGKSLKSAMKSRNGLSKRRTDQTKMREKCAACKQMFDQDGNTIPTSFSSLSLYTPSPYQQQINRKKRQVRLNSLLPIMFITERFGAVSIN